MTNDFFYDLNLNSLQLMNLLFTLNTYHKVNVININDLYKYSTPLQLYDRIIHSIDMFQYTITNYDWK